MSSKSLILVGGMHRSGTSLLAGLLQIAGAELGRDLFPARKDNKRGFFERRAVVAAHNEILRNAAAPWDDLRTFRCETLSAEQRQAGIDALVNALESDVLGTHVTAVKDPRASLLVPLWIEIFEHFEAKPRFLQVTRPVHDIQFSLFRRNGFSANRSAILWANYSTEFERNTRGFIRHSVELESIIEDPIQSIESIGQALELDLRTADIDEDQLIEFVDQGLLKSAAIECTSACEWVHQLEVDLSSAWANPQRGTQISLPPTHAFDTQHELLIEHANIQGMSLEADVERLRNRIGTLENAMQRLMRDQQM